MEENIITKIYKSTLRFLVPQTLEETYPIIVQEAVKLVNAAYGSIILEQNGELVRVYSSSPVAFQTQNRKQGNTHKAFTSGKTVVADISETITAHPELGDFGVQSTIFIPLSYQRKSIGVLTVNLPAKTRASKKTLRTLELFGSMVSLAIRKAQLNDETQKTLENRDLFISMSAHELRTPITTIYGYSQLLNQKVKGEVSTEARWINALHTESYRLTLLINDLLEINRIKAGRLQYVLKECHLREVLDRAVNNFKFNYPEREVILDDQSTESGDRVIGDFDRLLQMIINLLDNAAKFSSFETKIIIILKYDSSNHIIRVKDRGKGIAQKDLPRVFEGYFRGIGNQHEGFGLGLFLVKNIVEEHHGSVHIHSRLGKGTTVEIQLPRVKV